MVSSHDFRVVLSLVAILLTTFPWQAAAQGNGVPQRLAALEALVQQLQADLAAETAARMQADATLQAKLDAETAARAAADIALQNNIDNEAEVRFQAEIDLQSNIDAIQPATVPQSLLDLAPFVKVNASCNPSSACTMEGLVGPHIIFTGANVHIRSGMVGALNRDLAFLVSTVGDSYARNGLGNLVVGYNSALPGYIDPPVRTGSHNLIVGDGHSFTGSGGFVAGFANQSLQDGTSVLGGWRNTAGCAPAPTLKCGAGGLFATVSGGYSNEATGFGAAISGGSGNIATGRDATVSGGAFRTASAANDHKP